MSVIIHPQWIAKAGAGDLVRHFKLRGFDVSNLPGSRYMHVEPHEPPPVRPPPKDIVRLYSPRLHNFWPCS